MDSRWIEAFILHSKTDEFLCRLKEAQSIIRHALSLHKKPYVAFSGGKDSLCVAHLVTRQNPDVMILHWDYGKYYIPRPLHQEIISIAERLGWKLRVETSEKYEKLGRQAINVIGQDFLGKLVPQLKEEGYDCVFVGLRKEESSKRRLRIKAKRSITDIPEYHPVQNWTWMDVWAYIVSNKLPYLSHYDRYAPVVGWNRARFTTLFDPEFDKFGCSNVDGVLSWKWRE